TSSETLAELPAAVDLHARPAADFVRTAMRFEAQIRVAVDDREADAKSLMAVLGLGARGGTTLRLTADGTDADRALDRLAACTTAAIEWRTRGWCASATSLEKRSRPRTEWVRSLVPMLRKSTVRAIRSAASTPAGVSIIAPSDGRRTSPSSSSARSRARHDR